MQEEYRLRLLGGLRTVNAIDKARLQTSDPLRREAVVAGEADGALRWSGGGWHGHHGTRSVLGTVSLCLTLMMLASCQSVVTPREFLRLHAAGLLQPAC